MTEDETRDAAEDLFLQALATDGVQEVLSEDAVARLLDLVQPRRGAMPIVAHAHPRVASAMRDYYRKSSAQFRRVLTFAAELQRLTQERGLRVLVLKGLGLGLTCYSNPVDRRMGDLDVMVQPDELSEFDELVRGLGYNWESDCPPEFNVFDHQAPYAHPDSPELPYLDIHWGLEAHNYGNLTPRLLLEGAHRVPLNARTSIEVPGPEHHYLLLCCHMYKEWASREPRKPSQLIDLRRLTDRHPEVLPTSLASASQLGCSLQVAWATAVASALWPWMATSAGLDLSTVGIPAELRRYVRRWFFSHALSEEDLALEERLLAPHRPGTSRALARCLPRGADWPSSSVPAGELAAWAETHAAIVIPDTDGNDVCHLAIGRSEVGLHFVARARMKDWRCAAVIPNTLELSTFLPGADCDRRSLALRLDPTGPVFGARAEMWPYPPNRKDAIVSVGDATVAALGPRECVARFTCPWDAIGGRPSRGTDIRLEATIIEPIDIGAVSPHDLLPPRARSWHAWAAPHRFIWHGLLPSEMGTLRFA